jgi:hypothetical protein
LALFDTVTTLRVLAKRGANRLRIRGVGHSIASVGYRHTAVSAITPFSTPRVVDPITTIRQFAVRAASIGFRVTILRTVVAPFSAVMGSVPTIRIATVRAAGVGDHIRVVVTVVALLFPFDYAVSTNANQNVVVVVEIGVLT